MRKKIKRCNICSSKLDKNGDCTWNGCPKSPKYEFEAKEIEESKEENQKGKK